MKPWIILGLVVAAAAAGGGYYAYRHLGQADDGALVLYGNVDIRQVDLAFNVEGRIDRMILEEGDPAEQGRLMATLEKARFEDAVAAAKATVAARQAALDRLEAGSRPQEIEKSRADVKSARASWEAAKASLQRIQSLAAKDFVSQQALDDARAAEESAQARLEAARETLNLVVIGPRKEDIAKARAELDAARAELALARERLEDTVLYAPADGIVLTRVQEPGAVVMANTPIYSLALRDPMWARAYVSGPDLGRVHPGMTAKITTDSASDRVYEGWVGFISPTAEFTPKTVETPEIRTSLVYRLRVYIRNPDNSLRQGMPVTIRLVTDDAATGRPGGSGQAADKASDAP